MGNKSNFKKVLSVVVFSGVFCQPVLTLLSTVELGLCYSVDVTTMSSVSCIASLYCSLV